MKKLVLVSLSMLLLAGDLMASGPASTLYFTSQGSVNSVAENYMVLAGTTTPIESPQNSYYESAIAAWGGNLYVAQSESLSGGSVYDANFNYVSSLTNSIPPTTEIFDGTTDGTFNYGIDLVSGNVYEFNSTWGGTPTVIFQAAGASPIGISYDPVNNSLWTSDYMDGTVRDYSMTGTLLSSFNDGYSAGIALAFDPADDTLWLNTQHATGDLAQYSTSGTLLQTMTLDISNPDILGAAFMLNPVPEPSTASLLAVAGILGLAFRYRRVDLKSSKF